MMEYRNADMEDKSNLGYGTEVPPLLEYVKIMCAQQDIPEKDAIAFFTHFQENGWQTKTGVPIKNWKHILDQWIWDLKKVI